MEIEFEYKNKVLVTFTDGSTMTSEGSSSGINEHDLCQDLKWLEYTLPGYIRDEGKSMIDLKKVEIVIDYKQNI